VFDCTPNNYKIGNRLLHTRCLSVSGRKVFADLEAQVKVPKIFILVFNMSSGDLQIKFLASDAQRILPSILRDRIYESRYWKEQCFGIDAETILDRSREIDSLGITYGGSSRPTHFVCLLLKLLQIRPDLTVLKAYLDHSTPVAPPLSSPRNDLRYMRALAVLYVRLVGTPRTVFELLEPCMSDFRTVHIISQDGSFKCIFFDEFVESLIGASNSVESIDLPLPYLPSRKALEDKGVLRKYEGHLNE
jgi:pre-mRNA-splicing factor 38A